MAKNDTPRAEATQIAPDELKLLRRLKADREASNAVYEQAVRDLEASDLFKRRQQAESEFTQDDQAAKMAQQSIYRRYRMGPHDQIDMDTGQITRLD